LGSKPIGEKNHLGYDNYEIQRDSIKYLLFNAYVSFTTPTLIVGQKVKREAGLEEIEE